MYSDEEGILAVRVARDVLDKHVRGEEEENYELPDTFKKKRGAFVTLQRFPEGTLRGCIGYPYPLFRLEETIIRAAKSAASSDPRFREVQPKELDAITVEVSLLSSPEELVVKKRKDIPKQIVVGKHGLMVESGSFKGLLLPQVAHEWDWSPREFLEETCLKARLPATIWTDEKVRVFTFTADVFHETEPGGDVERAEMLN